MSPWCQLIVVRLNLTLVQLSFSRNFTLAAWYIKWFIFVLPVGPEWTQPTSNWPKRTWDEVPDNSLKKAGPAKHHKKCRQAQRGREGSNGCRKWPQKQHTCVWTEFTTESSYRRQHCKNTGRQVNRSQHVI